MSPIFCNGNASLRALFQGARATRWPRSSVVALCSRASSACAGQRPRLRRQPGWGARPPRRAAVMTSPRSWSPFSIARSPELGLELDRAGGGAPLLILRPGRLIEDARAADVTTHEPCDVGHNAFSTH